MFSRPKILLLVSLLFVALLNSIPTYLLNFLIFYHSSIYRKDNKILCVMTYIQSESNLLAMSYSKKYFSFVGNTSEN